MDPAPLGMPAIMGRMLESSGVLASLGAPGSPQRPPQGLQGVTGSLPAGFTVLCPTDSAFPGIPRTVQELLFDPTLGLATRQSLGRYHVIPHVLSVPVLQQGLGQVLTWPTLLEGHAVRSVFAPPDSVFVISEQTVAHRLVLPPLFSNATLSIFQIEGVLIPADATLQR